VDDINSASGSGKDTDTANDADANDKNDKGEPNESGVSGAGAGAGRPRKEKGQKMTEFPLYILMHNQDALDKVKRAAQLEGLSVSAWARIVLLRAARERLRDDGEE
jgi:hypothetical protein